MAAISAAILPPSGRKLRRKLFVSGKILQWRCAGSCPPHFTVFRSDAHLKKRAPPFPVPDENNPQELQLIDTMLQLGQFIQTDAPDKWFIP
jgi:hypothetical protein